jgi:hypothetical protein
MHTSSSHLVNSCLVLHSYSDELNTIDLYHHLVYVNSLDMHALKDYFDLGQRVEIAHVMSWMVGYTEYGKISPTHWELGYYDRIEDKCVPYLRQDFPRADKYITLT